MIDYMQVKSIVSPSQFLPTLLGVGGLTTCHIYILLQAQNLH